MATIALRTADLVADGATPSAELLAWFGERRDVDVMWTADDTHGLVDVASRDAPRAVRLLYVSGVLERGVPAVAEWLGRRRADPAELDPARVLRFPTVSRLGASARPTVPRTARR